MTSNSSSLKVECSVDGDGYRCRVEVADGTSTTRHLVRVSPSDLERWGRGRSVDQLVKDSFDFLLKREPKESILGEFDLSVIKRYFPEYDGA